MNTPPIKNARICYQCDKDLYPKGKVLTDDQFAHRDSKGNWHCMDCMKEDADNELIRRLPNSLAAKNIVAERVAKKKKKLAFKEWDAKVRRMKIDHRKEVFCDRLARERMQK